MSPPILTPWGATAPHPVSRDHGAGPCDRAQQDRCHTATPLLMQSVGFIVGRMAFPDFFLVGAPKAGTSALHAALAQHPQLYLSPVKEPKYFLCDGAPPTANQRGPGDAHSAQEWIWRRDRYEALFDAAPPGSVRGESTPFYLYDRDAHARIAQRVPDARIVAIVRDPVDRAYSNWMHLWSDGLEPEADFARAWALEDERIASGYAPFWHYRRLGLYGEQIASLRTYFQKGGFMFLADSWGTQSEEQWEEEISRVLPPAQYPLVQLPMTHSVWHTMFELKEIPQMPSIQYWRRSGGDISERGADSAIVEVRGISDKYGRLMVLAIHNSDIPDGWEREGEDPTYFNLFSPHAYTVAVDAVMYAMTH